MLDFRCANTLDIREVFEWRNDQTSLKMSINNKSISWNTHTDWFNNILKDENHCLLICFLKKEKQKVGCVRYDIENKFAYVSINLAPHMRGKGLSKDCLTITLEYIKKEFKEVETVNARIKISNLISQKIFKEVGFSIKKSTKKIVHYEYILKVT